jgi:hypothetical protein
VHPACVRPAWARTNGVRVPCIWTSRRLSSVGEILDDEQLRKDDRPWKGSLKIKTVSLRTETAYKADASGKVAQHTKAQGPDTKVNALGCAVGGERSYLGRPPHHAALQSREAVEPVTVALRAEESAEGIVPLWP